MFLGTNYSVTKANPKPPVSPLSPEMLIEDAKETIILTDAALDVFVLPIEQVSAWVDNTLIHNHYLAYVTGGFQGSLAQINLMHFLQINTIPILLGLEPDTFIERKGRRIIVPIEQRLALWKHCAPNFSCIFFVPKQVENYDDLAKTLGVYKRRGILHIGNDRDLEEINEARRNRCYDTSHYLELSTGAHVADYCR